LGEPLALAFGVVLLLFLLLLVHDGVLDPRKLQAPLNLSMLVSRIRKAGRENPTFTPFPNIRITHPKLAFSTKQTKNEASLKNIFKILLHLLTGLPGISEGVPARKPLIIGHFWTILRNF
jgi:hypothetical protein